MKTVLIDVGHGGNDSGATGYGLREADVALETSKLVAAFLRAFGHSVALTRTADTTLLPLRRKELIVQPGFDCVISIHYNAASSPAVHGFEIFHSAHNQQSKLLGEALDNQFRVRATFIPPRQPSLKTRIRRDGYDFYYVINEPTKFGIPAVLIEPGFLTNEQDANYFKNFWNIFATAFTIALGVDDYLKSIAAPKDWVNQGVRHYRERG